MQRRQRVWTTTVPATGARWDRVRYFQRVGGRAPVAGYIARAQLTGDSDPYLAVLYRRCRRPVRPSPAAGSRNSCGSGSPSMGPGFPAPRSRYGSAARPPPPGRHPSWRPAPAATRASDLRRRAAGMMRRSFDPSQDPGRSRRVLNVEVGIDDVQLRDHYPADAGRMCRCGECPERDGDGGGCELHDRSRPVCLSFFSMPAKAQPLGVAADATAG
jgi:hypothetical protein